MKVNKKYTHISEGSDSEILLTVFITIHEIHGEFLIEGCCSTKNDWYVCLYACMCVCNCVSRSSRMYSRQPGQVSASFSCPSCMDGYHTNVHQTVSLAYTSCHCSLSLFPFSFSSPFFPFVIIRWQKRCRLSASHWLLDIESGKGRGVPSRPYTFPHSFAWRPSSGVFCDGGCASVSAPALYPFLSITVQVKQMIGFSQRGD